MRKLLKHRHILSQNMLSIIGLCLFFYFGYHAAFGERSFFRLYSLQHDVSELSHAYDALKQEREAINKKVVMMRPGTVDRDLLEERVQYVLGYAPQETKIILH